MREKRSHGEYRPLGYVSFVILSMLLAAFSGCIGADDTEVEIEELKVSLDAIQGDEDENGHVIVTAVASGGEEPYSYLWTLDGDEMLATGPQLMMSGLLSGQHTVGVSLASADGQVIESNVIFTIPTPNRAPQCLLSVETPVYEGESSNWTLTSSDADDDSLNHEVFFSDGTMSDQTSGEHAWTGYGVRNVTATVADPDGLDATCTASVEVTANKAPEISVEITPIVEGTIILLVDEELELAITVTDQENNDISLTIDWGDGSATSGQHDADHSYDSAGDYVITINASDSYGMSLQTITVEVIEELNDSAAFELYDDQFSEDDPSAELDEDGDETVDDAEAAESEEGLDVDDTFDVDQQGVPGHDGGTIDAWQTQDMDHIGDVADSNDTAGGGRDSDAGDTLTDATGRTNENETELESPIDDISADELIREELFSEGDDPFGVVEDEPPLDEEVYESLVDSRDSVRFEHIFSVDHDGDGVNDTECGQQSAAFWIDANHDGNAERAILYRATHCINDPDGDGVAEITFVEIEGLNWTDQNDDGTPEVVMALHLEHIVWSNNSHLRTDTKSMLQVAAIADLDQDGNNEYLLIGHLEIINIDTNSDGLAEGEAIEINVAFAKDMNDDGTPEVGLLLKMNDVKYDLDGDGNINTHVFYIQAVHVNDADRDGNLDSVIAAQYGGFEWDNNSDGRVDSSTIMWLGVGLRDTDMDGVIDRTTMAVGGNSVEDADGDGRPEAESATFAASRIDDSDSDGTPEHGWYLVYHHEVVDSDDDGLAETRTEMAAGARAWDWDDDGNFDRLVAVMYGKEMMNETSSGIFQQTNTAVWLLEVADWNSDGSPNTIHAVTGFESAWDNNSDGVSDTSFNRFNGWFGQDADHDGYWERQVFVRFTKSVSDDDADGELEGVSEEYLIHLKHSSPLGMSHEWFLYSSSSKFNVSVDGIAWYENNTVAAYETWNNSQTQETHARIAWSESLDAGRDGSKEYEASGYRDNRVSE